MIGARLFHEYCLLFVQCLVTATTYTSKVSQVAFTSMNVNSTVLSTTENNVASNLKYNFNEYGKNVQIRL